MLTFQRIFYSAPHSSSLSSKQHPDDLILAGHKALAARYHMALTGAELYNFVMRSNPASRDYVKEFHAVRCKSLVGGTLS
jgi:hypothetical protein